MKTAISLPDDLFRAAERVAKKKGLSRSELYATALAALLRQEDDDDVTAQLNRVYGASPATLDESLAALPARVLEREDW
jgi:metal-responsive CopG/Arc/MetJ family transcriptional regulator